MLPEMRTNPTPSRPAGWQTPLSRKKRLIVYDADALSHNFLDGVNAKQICWLRDWLFRVPPEQRIDLAPPNYGAIYPCVVHLDVPYVVIILTE